MVVYFSVFLVGMFASLLENLGIRPNSRAILTFQFWAVLALFAGLRGANVRPGSIIHAVERHLSGAPDGRLF